MKQVMVHITESAVEEAVLAWLESLGHTILSGPEIAPGELQAAHIEGRMV